MRTKRTKKTEAEYQQAKGVVASVLKGKDLSIKGKPNVIFLDVDGVLNCEATYEKHRVNSYTGLDDGKIGILRQMTDIMNAKIILVSDWKDHWSKDDKENQDEFGMILDWHLLQQGLVISDRTYERFGNERGQGIIDWIDKQPEGVDKILILDDNMFDYERTGLTKYLIRTEYHDENGGLTEEHVKRLKEMLPGLAYAKSPS